MHRDTIHRLPDDCLTLGARRHTVRYNDFDFNVEVTARPISRSTNENAKKLSALHMEANIRKSAAGLGMGQYLSPEQLKDLQNGKVVVSAIIAGKSYTVPVEVTPGGEYSCAVLKSRSNSLREVCSKVMDALFEHNGIDNMYRSTPGMRNAVAERAAAVNYEPRGYGGMRM